MSDTVISSQNLTVVYDTDNSADFTDLMKFVLPDCKSNLTESELKNVTLFDFMYYPRFGIETKKGQRIYAANMLTADITATEKINISLE